MKKYMSTIVSVLTVIFTSGFQAVFLYCQNADEAGVDEVMPALINYVFIGLTLMLVFLVITRSISKAAISASIMALLLTNFALIEKVLKLALPGLRYWHTAPIIIVIGLHLVFLFCHFTKEQLAEDVANVVCLVFAALIVVNLTLSVPQILGHYRAQKVIDAARQEEKKIAEGVGDQPNIYYFMFDEYANFNQAKEIFNYDNNSLKEFLNKYNFSISYESYNESVVSSTIQTNIVNLNYIVTDDTSESEKEVFRKKGHLFDLMREHGYEVEIYEASSFYGGCLPQSDVVDQAVTMGGESLYDILMSKTIIYPFTQSNSANGLSKILQIVNYFSNQDCIPKNATFTLIYLNFPHPPYIADENGNAISGSNYLNPNFYIGQYKYSTKLMMQMLDNIIGNDPSSIIILQSDHSMRSYKQYINNPLNTLYWGGKEGPEIEGLSSVNTMRAILNALWNDNYEMLNVPEYNEF